MEIIKWKIVWVYYRSHVNVGRAITAGPCVGKWTQKEPMNLGVDELVMKQYSPFITIVIVKVLYILGQLVKHSKTQRKF